MDNNNLDKEAIRKQEEERAELLAKIAALEASGRMDALKERMQEETPSPAPKADKPIETPKKEAPDNNKKSEAGHKALTIFGIIASIILIPILVVNITLITKSFIHKDEVPMFGGVVPMIVDTDSMYPLFEMGDLVIVKKIPAKEVKVGDVITFFDPELDGPDNDGHHVVTTHRVTNIVTGEDGKLSFETKGDANNTKDETLVPQAKLIGKYTKTLKGLGNFVLFMQSTAGLIIFAVMPVIIILLYDIIRRRLHAKKNKGKTDALLAELEALKKEKAARELKELEELRKSNNER